MQLIKILNII